MSTVDRAEVDPTYAFRDLRRLRGSMERAEHGTYTRYAAGGCRCPLCVTARRDRERERSAKRRELAAEIEIVPSGPPGHGNVGKGRMGLLCPGANGQPCVAGGSWLKGQQVCMRCVDRLTVWNGLVPATRVREHLLALREQGVGYKSVAAASSVGASALGEILSGKKTSLRALTERRIVAVDASAMADHQPVPLGPTLALVDKMLARGFTRGNISALLGNKTRALQFGVQANRILARNAAAVERLWRRIERGEVVPASPFEPAEPIYELLRKFRAAGLSWEWLSKRLGWNVSPAQMPQRVRKTSADKVRALVAELEAHQRDNEGLPDGWQATGSAITAAFGFAEEGGNRGWDWDRRTSKAAQKREAAELRRLARRSA